MDRSQKADAVAQLNAVFNEVSVVVVTRNLGMTVDQSTDLRTKMRDAGATYAKSNDKLEIVGGSMGTQVLDEAGIKALASMPSLDELRGKIVGLVNAPATKVAQVVNAPAAKLARVFGAYGAKDAA